MVEDTGGVTCGKVHRGPGKAGQKGFVQQVAQLNELRLNHAGPVLKGTFTRANHILIGEKRPKGEQKWTG